MLAHYLCHNIIVPIRYGIETICEHGNFSTKRLISLVVTTYFFGSMIRCLSFIWSVWFCYDIAKVIIFNKTERTSCENIFFSIKLLISLSGTPSWFGRSTRCFYLRWNPWFCYDIEKSIKTERNRHGKFC